MKRPLAVSHTRSPAWLALLALLLAGLGLYFVLRFGGRWMEIDTLRLTASAQAVVDQAALAPSGAAYQFGYTYPVVVAWLAQAAGLPVPLLQTTVLPVVGVAASALVALVFFRALLGAGPASFLATLLLFLQADFLFVTMRGSHEKLTWPLVMTALLLLVRSTKNLRSFRSLLVRVALFYLAIYALIATSYFFASSLITAISLAFMVGIFLVRLQSRGDHRPEPRRFQRLALVSASAMILLYTFVFYIYAPAGQALSFIPSIVDKIAAFFLGFQPQASPYAYIVIGWAYPWAYPLLSAFTWLLLGSSLLEWLYQGYRLVRGARLTLPEWLPWLLYTGFAVQVAVAIVIDFAGVLSANLQLRLLPGLVIFAAALAAQALQRLLRSASPLVSRLLPLPLALLVVGFLFASLLKASNDPVVSNKWMFYSSSEASALDWSAARIKNGTVWVGLDERLALLPGIIFTQGLGSTNTYITELYNGPLVSEFTTRYFLLSDIERYRHARIGKALPDAVLENLVYDNGNVQFFYRRALTPYQK